MYSSANADSNANSNAYDIVDSHASSNGNDIGNVYVHGVTNNDDNFLHCF